jgi:hypothetical protein
LARAKNTCRSEARRRTRELTRAELLAAEGETVDSPEMVDDGTAIAVPAERPRMFKAPNVRADLKALPQMFRTKRLLWVPLVLLLVGLALTLAVPGLAPEAASIAALFVQFFFIPPALFTFFIAGFIAPRGSYLVGLIYGVLAGVMWTIAFVPPAALAEPSAFMAEFAGLVMTGALYGTLAAAFAAWYRDFLRGMQERGKVRRAEQEAKLRAQRRDERQESRRVAKQRT